MIPLDEVPKIGKFRETESRSYQDLEEGKIWGCLLVQSFCLG